MTEKDTSYKHVSLENREAMLRSFFDAIRLSFCGAANIVPNLQDVDWKSVARLSMMQQVVALVYIALLKDRCGCPDDVYTFIETNTMSRMLRNAIKQENADELLKESYQRGIKLAVMKGQEIADCYDDIPWPRLLKRLFDCPLTHHLIRVSAIILHRQIDMHMRAMR